MGGRARSQAAGVRRKASPTHVNRCKEGPVVPNAHCADGGRAVISQQAHGKDRHACVVGPSVSVPAHL